jgi:uncharacterized protein
MNLDDEQESSNIVDRRGERAGGGMRLGGGKLGIGGMIVVGVIALLLGQNPLAMIGMVEGAGGPGVGQPQQQAPATPAALSGEHDRFIAKVLGSTERTWDAVFRDQLGRAYPQPKLNLFQGGVNSGCGQADSGMGPFYCPADKQVYLDASFFDDLSRRFGAPGDFAAAYVIAHEVGHHIQTVLGTSARVQQARQSSSEVEANALSVRQELQADCYAGVWAYHNRDLLEPGDIEEGLRAAQAIGDDTLQRGAGRRVNPESFTHGSSEQRMRWLQAGLQSGQMNSCDTFAARRL